MDNLNQLGKQLNENRDVADTALSKNKPIIPQIERTRDVMDYTVPFEMEFRTQREGHRVTLDLNFMPPPKTGCCADCVCTICEFFAGGITETLYQVTYAYVPGTVHAYKNNAPTPFQETDPTLGRVTVWAQNDSDVVICYVYDTCIGGALPTSESAYINYPSNPPPPGSPPGTPPVQPPPPPPPWQVPPPVTPPTTGPANLSGSAGDEQVTLNWT